MKLPDNKSTNSTNATFSLNSDFNLKQMVLFRMQTSVGQLVQATASQSSKDIAAAYISVRSTIALIIPFINSKSEKDDVDKRLKLLLPGFKKCCNNKLTQGNKAEFILSLQTLLDKAVLFTDKLGLIIERFESDTIK